MTTETSNQWRLAQLNSEIELLESTAPPFDAEREKLAKAARSASRKWRYLRLAQLTRSPAASFEMWSYLLLVVGSLLCGVVSFILLNLVGGTFGWSFLAFLLGTAAGGGLIASLLYRPADGLLPAELAAAESEHRVAQARLDELIQAQAAEKHKLGGLLEERRQLMASGKVQRAALLQREWKSMPTPEWEDFVVEVLRTLGATVERSARSLDTGAVLIAHFEDRNVAIITHGEGHVANSECVQHALAAQKRHHCGSCAVILNRRFTGAAQLYAANNGCTLVGVEQFPDLVLGKLRL